jgi:hypothetical protein
MLAGGVGIAIAVGLQYLLIFRSILAVAGVTAAAALLAWGLIRNSVEAFAIAIRYNLGLETTESTGLYTEVI